MKYEIYEIGELASQARGLAIDPTSGARQLRDCLDPNELLKIDQMLQDYEQLLRDTGKVKTRVVRG